MPTCPSCQNLTGLSTLSCPSCGDSLPLDPGAEVGGRYEILERLGAGGMGTVYRATDRDLDQQVAVKFIRVGAHPQAMARFKSEIRLARRVRHKNVCAVWQNGYEGEFAYIVMELIEGRTLRELVKEQGPLAWSRACSLALQAAQGLEAIHEAGVIHRDVKSSNLMLDDSGVVRLLDFGIAKGDPSQPGLDLTGPRRITDSNQVVGSPEYMSPEQIQGLPLDARTDIYSFGIVIYELFTGRVPFRGTSAFDTMMLHVREPPPLGGTEASTIPPVVVPILQRALAKSQDDRYPSMRALIKDLKGARLAIDKGRTEPGDLVDGPPPPASWWRRAEVWAPLAGLILGLTVLRALSDAPDPPPSSPAGATEQLRPSPSPTILAIEMSARVEITPPFSTAPTPSPRPTDPPVTAKPPPQPTSRPTPAAAQSAAPTNPVPDKPALVHPPTDPLIPPTTTAPPAPAAEPTASAPPSPSLPARGTLYQVGDPDLVVPTCLVCPTLYPSILERARLEGIVPVELLVDEEGRVQEPRALGTARKELKAAAVDTVKKWQYRPATRLGVPGKMVVQVNVSFLLDGASRR